jgi:UTP--glucose-1-phosphate uridylyltransferase
LSVRKAVIPAGGLGTRLLPLSKAVPKELLPVFHKPLVQLAVEELAGAGIQETVLVVSPGKRALETFFQPDPQLEQALRASGSPQADMVAAIPKLSRFSFVEQARPLGLGHAVLMAADAVGDEPFATVLPDDLVLNHRSATQQLLDVFQQYGGCVLAVEQVATEHISQYGVIDGTEVADGVFQVHRLVEKPPPEEAPSNLAIVGRYVLTPQIFEALRHTPPGAKGEIQLTDGIGLLLEEQPVYACVLQGRRHDGGSPLGLLKAALDIALRDPSWGDDLRAFLDVALSSGERWDT